MVAGRCFIRNDSNLLASVNLLEVVLAVSDFQQIQGAQQIGVPKVRVLAKEAVGDRRGCTMPPSPVVRMVQATR